MATDFVPLGGGSPIEAHAPLSRSALGDQVADRLRDAILRGIYAPGDLMPEAQLANSFAVSRGPIREALTVLEREGLVTSRPHRTASVVVLTREDLDELYSLRLALEILASRWAVRRAEGQDIERLVAAVKALQVLTAGPFSEFELARTDIMFHDAIYAASHHNRLISAWSGVRSQVYLFLLKRNLTNRDLPTRDWTSRLVSDHDAILGRLRDRDEHGMVQLLEAHLREPYVGLVHEGGPGRSQVPSESQP